MDRNPVELKQKLKDHIRFEDGMDENLLPFYIESATRYVNKKVGKQTDYLIIMVATVMYDNRSSSEDLKAALDALEMIFALEVLTDGKEEPDIDN